MTMGSWRGRELPSSSYSGSRAKPRLESHGRHARGRTGPAWTTISDLLDRLVAFDYTTVVGLIDLALARDAREVGFQSSQLERKP